MGYSSWNDCGSVVTEAHIKATATAMIESGLAAKGCARSAFSVLPLLLPSSALPSSAGRL